MRVNITVVVLVAYQDEQVHQLLPLLGSPGRAAADHAGQQAQQHLPDGPDADGEPAIGVGHDLLLVKVQKFGMIK